MRFRRFRTWLIAIGLIFLAAVFAGRFMPRSQEERNFRRITLIDPAGKEEIIDVEIAATDEARQRGLMFRSSMTQGMLFLFDRPQMLSFWMKNTLIPLDIVFFDGEGKYVSSLSMTPCKKDPCPLYSSQMEAKYALEMWKGFIDEAEIGSGWLLRL